MYQRIVLYCSISFNGLRNPRILLQLVLFVHIKLYRHMCMCMCVGESRHSMIQETQLHWLFPSPIAFFVAIYTTDPLDTLGKYPHLPRKTFLDNLIVPPGSHSHSRRHELCRPYCSAPIVHEPIVHFTHSLHTSILAQSSDTVPLNLTLTEITYIM